MKKIFSFIAAAMFCFAANATDYYFAGDANGWSNNNASFKFVEVDGVLTVNIPDLYGSFKITEDGNWHPQHGGVGGEGVVVYPLKFNVPYSLGGEADDGEASNLPVDLTGDYRYKDAKLTLTFGEGSQLVLTLVAGTLYDHSTVGPTYQLVGACTNNWSTADAIQFEDKDGVLTATVEDLNGTFKVIQDRAWTNQWATNWENGGGLELGKPYTMGGKGDAGTEGDPKNLALANPFGGYKNAVLTLTVGEKMILTLVSGEFYVVKNDWFLPGEALGWECKDAQKFAPVAGKENTYEYLAAEFKGEFKVVYGNWGVEFGRNADEDKWEINKPYTMKYPAFGNGNFGPADAEAVYTDITITIVVDYEKAEVNIVLADENYTGVETLKTDRQALKRIVDGQLIIEKNGIRYNVLGTEIK